jgi:CheY-like chemotaxis protein
MASWHFDVRVVHDGEAAWAEVTEPCAASGDRRLDDAGARRTRSVPAGSGTTASTAHLYVILLTSRDSREDLVAGLNAGADDYLVKPFDHEELLARLRVGVRVVTLQERLAERVTALGNRRVDVEAAAGLIPICSYCKRIRSEGNDWEQLESYISEHSNAQFSHGICPPCLSAAVRGDRRHADDARIRPSAPLKRRPPTQSVRCLRKRPYNARAINTLRRSRSKAGRDAQQAEPHLHRHVPERQRVIAFAAEGERIEAEARKRREAAQDADEHEGPHRLRQLQAVGREQPGQHADDDAAGEVDRRCRVGHRPVDEAANQHVDAVARHGAERPADRDRDPRHRCSSPRIGLDVVIARIVATSWE